MAGLQGAGKTTSVGKLGKFLREKHKKKVLVVSAEKFIARRQSNSLRRWQSRWALISSLLMLVRSR